MFDGFPGAVAGNKGEENHAERPYVGGFCGEGSGIAATMCGTLLIQDMSDGDHRVEVIEIYSPQLMYMGLPHRQ